MPQLQPQTSPSFAPLDPSAVTERFRHAPDRLIDANGGAVAYRKFGSGPDVLFVHGWPCSGATFRALIPYLAPHVTCHVIDLPGAGHSRFDRDTPLDLATHVDRIRVVIDALGLTDFAGVGHDSGGLMLRHAVVGDPRLRSLGLVDTEQSQGLAWPFRRLLALTKVPGFTRFLAWAVMQPGLRRSSLVLGGCFADASLLGGEFEEFFLRPVHDDPERADAAGRLAKAFDLDFVHQLADVHARLDVPVKLVWGEHDPYFPVDWTREMVDTFPNASLHVVEGMKLFVHEEAPAEVADALLPTLL